MTKQLGIAKDRFQKVLKQLNPNQAKAVKTIEGPVMVIAGPGTGKTHVLAARIGYILKTTDLGPHNILALTFTESAAHEMRQRIVDMIGQAGYYVEIGTFHGFCRQIISSYPEYFQIDRESEVLSDLERYDLLQNIIMELDLDLLKPLNLPLFYLKEVIKGISDLKREGFSPGDFQELLKKLTQELEENSSELSKTEQKRQIKALAKQKELGLIYEHYEKRLRKNLRYDFDDMISLVKEAFANNQDLRRECQEKLQYILVDEYQDTNNAQNQVVAWLAEFWGQDANLFVVGDPHQAIYRFQGASVENMLGFGADFPKAEVVTLTTGYRCTQPLYNAAHALIGHNTLTDPQNLETSSPVKKILAKALATRLQSPDQKSGPRSNSTTKRATTTSTTETKHSLAETKRSLTETKHSLAETEHSLQLLTAPSDTLERVLVVERVEALINSGVAPEQIAVLYRHNADSLELGRIFDKWGLPYETSGGGDVLESPSIIQLLSLLELIASLPDGSEDEALFSVLSYDWVPVDNLLAMKLMRAAAQAKLSLFDLVQAGFDKFAKHHPLDDVTPIEFEQVRAFVAQLIKWVASEANQTFPTWFEQVINESGYLEWILDQPAKGELLTELNSLFREIKSLAQTRRRLRLTDFLQALAVMSEHGLGVKAASLGASRQAVCFSTVHKAKGQEWDHVFLLHAYDGKWSNTRQRNLLPLPEGILSNTDLSKKERNEDDRRLFYVGLTRARKGVVVSLPEAVESDQGRSQPVVESMFVGELRQTGLLSEEVDSINLKQAEDRLEKLLTTGQKKAPTTSDKQFFKHLVDKMRLSVTGLNTYLRDPQEFLHNFILRVPRAKPAPMAFGTAVHVALEKWNRLFQEEGKLPKLEFLLDSFQEALHREELTPDDLKRRLKYGREILTKYYQDRATLLKPPLFVEQFFGYGLRQTVLDDVPLTGRIDRVDWLDQNKKTVKVIDYKTGKPRSLGDIQGETVAAGLSERERELPDSIKGPYKRQLLFYKLLTELDPTFIPKVEVGVFEFVEPNKQNDKLIQRQVALPDDEVKDLENLIKEVMAEIRDLKFLDTL